MIGIVVSEADSASVHVGEQLRAAGEWTPREDATRPAADGGGTYYRTEGAAMRTVEELHLETVDVAAAFDADPAAVVFVSRHAGETGPLLTAHFTGNLGPPEYGGEANELATAAPGVATAALAGLDARAPDGYDVSLECTHHGPTEVGSPSLFVEVGSDEEQWADPAAARAVAETVLELRDVPVRPDRTVVVLGGGHYAPRATRIARETGWAVGHVCADWGLDRLTTPAERRAVLAQAFERSGAEHAVVDGDRPEIADVVETVAELGHRVVSETWLREADGVPLDLVAALEDALEPVEDGLRFGEAASPLIGSPSADEFAVVDLPDELLAAARAVDPELARGAVDGVALGYETEENGNRVGDRAAVASAADRWMIVDGLAAILELEYEVERGPDAIAVRERAFDPALARERGVPEGPAFGKLAEGEPVTVDGETVDPEAVTRTQTREYPY